MEVSKVCFDIRNGQIGLGPFFVGLDFKSIPKWTGGKGPDKKQAAYCWPLWIGPLFW